MAACHDAKGQAHVAAAGREKVEEEGLLDTHSGIEQDDEVAWRDTAESMFSQKTYCLHHSKNQDAPDSTLTG